jgi:glutamyl-tRNA synthetase
MFNTRIAPSPTGINVHIGNLRTAYFNYLTAKASGGKFVLRIDDTDQNRHNEDAVIAIYDAMKWLGLDYDETFRQSQHKDSGLYDRAIQELLSNNLAYLDDNCIKLKTPEHMPSFWTDNVAGNVAITDKDKESISNLVLIKSDGFPTYHFSSVIDDAYSNINYVIRGNDHTSNTAKHIAIYSQMQKCNSSICDFKIPEFAHIGLIHKDKKKMSKSNAENDPTIFLSYYQENNYEPDAILDFLLRLGWGPKNEGKEHSIISKNRAIELFLDGGKMRSAPSNFDLVKLQSFDRKYKALKEKAIKSTV